MDDRHSQPLVSPTQILLRSGCYFDLAEPERSEFTIEDIAHALSNICRFTGHTVRFYSVAEHCWHCSFIVPPEHALAALLHDAAEAFVGDVASPLKGMLPDYRQIEARVHRAVLARFGLGPDLHPSVKQADMAMLLAEQRQAMSNRDRWFEVDGIEPAARHLLWMYPHHAAPAFLRRYDELTKGRAPHV